VQLTLPSGTQGQNFNGGSGELAQATVYMTMSDADFAGNGTITTTTTHNAWCPYAGHFINGVIIPIGNPMQVIYAYYHCNQSGGKCTQTTDPLFGEQVYTHRRCNTGSGVCPTVFSPGNNHLYSLWKVAQITIGPVVACAGVSDSESVSQCYSPDPIP
jgi:hypothetical protein